MTKVKSWQGWDDAIFDEYVHHESLLSLLAILPEAIKLTNTKSEIEVSWSQLEATWTFSGLPS